MKESEELEEFVLILYWDANTSICDGYLKVGISHLRLNDFDAGIYLAFLSELDGIWLDAQQHLHNSIFIAVHDGTVFWYDGAGTLIAYVFENGIEFNTFVFGLLSQNAHHFLDWVSHVELSEVVPELIILYLREVKHILDNKVHHLSRVLLGGFTLVKLLQDLDALLE